MTDALTLAAFTAALGLFGLSGGAVFLLLIRAVTWPGWMQALLPGLRLLAAVTPLSGAVLVVLAVAALPAYPWAAEPALNGYLSPLWSGLRLGVLVALFSLFGLIGALGLLNRRVAAVGLVVLSLGLSMVSVDWTLSLTETMKSSEFGLIVLFGWIVGTLALLCAAGSALWDAATRARWGAVLLTGVVFWIYLHLMHYLVLWGSASAGEARWWLARAETPWLPFLWTAGILHAVIPVLCLALPALRRSRLGLLLAGASVVAARAVETVLWTLPGLPAPGAVGPGLFAVLVPVLASLLLVFVLRRREVRHG